MTVRGTFDFETLPIQPGRGFPAPVGLAYALGDAEPIYVTERAAMRAAIEKLWGCDAVLGHNVSFDIGVACQHLGVPLPPCPIDDTLTLAFVLDPFARNLGLKELGQQYLDVPPTEQEAVREWLIEHKIVTRATKRWGAHIHRAPVALVGPYACQDVSLTRRLFARLSKQMRARHDAEQVAAAYVREASMIPVLTRMQLVGLHVDRGALHAWIETWERELGQLEDWLAATLPPGVNLNAPAQVAEGLVAVGRMTQMPRTPKGNVAFNAAQLAETDLDATWLAVWRARQQRTKMLRTYARPWEEMTQDDSRLHVSWQGTRGFENNAAWGARTGRLSSSPNLQNIPRAMAEVGLPAELSMSGAPELRRVITPAPGQVLLARDYSQQELRILAHFEQGELLELYTDDPTTDIHAAVADLIRRRAGLELPREQVKITSFSILYGAGLPRLSTQLGVSIDQARQIRNAYRRALPGIVQVQRRLEAAASRSQPFHTSGDRPYTFEVIERPIAPTPFNPSGGVRREIITHKALNHLIQGSAADCTKQAMVEYARTRQHGELVASIHDELWVEVPAEHAETEMEILRAAMESVAFDVPMLTDGVVCSTSIAEVKR